MKNRKEKEKKKKPENFLEFYQRYLMVPLIVLAVLFICALQFKEKCNRELTEGVKSLAVSAQSQEQFLQHYSREIRLYNTMQENYSRAALKITAMGEEGEEVTTETLDSLNQVQGDGNTYYYLKKDGSILGGTGKIALLLTYDEKNKLKKNGVLRTDDAVYFATACGEGMLIAKDVETQNVFTQYQPNLSTDYISFDADTGEVLGSSVSASSKVGLEKVRTMDDLNVYGTLYEVSSGITYTVFSLHMKDMTSFDALDIYLGIRSDYSIQDRNIVDYQFLSLRDFTWDAIRGSVVLMTLMVAFAFLSYRIAKSFKKRWMKEKAGGEIHFFGKVSADRGMLTNLAIVEGALTILVIFIMVFVQSQMDFANLYSNAEQNLKTLEAAYKSNQEDVDKMQQLFERGLKINTEACVRYLSNHADSPDSQENVNEFLRETAQAIGAEEISVFDESGVIEYSTTNYTGYQLSSMEDDPEYRLWQLIYGSRDSDIFELDPDNGIYCCAQRRSDKVGFVLVKISDAKLQQIKKEASFENLMISADFGNSDQFYVLGTDESVLYHIPSGTQQVIALDNMLPIPDVGSSYVAVTNIAGSSYFVDGRSFLENTVYCADNISTRLGGIVPIILILLLVCAIIVLFATAGILKTADEGTEPVPLDVGRALAEAVGEKETSDFLLREIQYAVRRVLILTALLLLFDYYTSPVSIPEFLFLVDWEQGINYLSFSAIIFMTVIVVLLWKLLRAAAHVLEHHLPSRSATICQMLTSLVSAAMFVFLVLYGLDLVGIQATTILAGVGLTGIIITVGAKGIIDDMVEGITIIIEGHIRVGDRIILDGFSTAPGKDAIVVGFFEGTVTHIGIRSTVVKGIDREIVVNNAGLKNVTNLSRSEGLAKIYFTVGFDTDMDVLSSRIADSEDRLKTAARGHIRGKVKFVGVINYNDHGMRCLVEASSKQENVTAVTTALYTEIAKILKENDIKLLGGS